MAASVLDLPRKIGRDDAEELVRRFEKIRTGRTNWESHWEEIAERIWPHANEFTERHRREPGTKRTEKIYDSTGALALEKFSSAMESLLTPRQQKWHRLRASNEELNEDTEVKEWFEEVTRILFAARQSPKAGYYSQLHESYKSLGAFGSQVMFIDERPDGGVRYKHIHIGQAYVEVDPNGDVDTIFRCFMMSAKAAEQRWGANLPLKIRQVIPHEPWKQFEFLHIVMPNENTNPDLMTGDGMRFRSVHIALDDRRVLEDGGYHENPYIFSRWTVNPVEVYGRSPAMLVLPSIKMVNEMQKTFIRAGHKLVDPPLLVRDDGVIGSGGKSIDLRPGGISYGGVSPDGRPLIQPLVTGARLDLTEGMIEKEREVINEAFLVTLFQILVDQPNMTATEALLRAQEKGQLIAPAVGRQQSELLGPQIERELNMLLRQGALPPPPDILLEAEGQYEIEYVSPATRFQRSEELVGIQRTIEIAAPFATVDPTVLDVFDAEQIIRLSAEINGAPTKVLRDPEELAAMREARAKQAASERALAGIESLTTSAKNMAGAVPAGAPGANA